MNSEAVSAPTDDTMRDWKRLVAVKGVASKAMHPALMSRDICCENFKGLLGYIRSHYRDDGIRCLTADLLDGQYFVQDNLAPDQIIPVGLKHLTGPAC